MGREALPPMGVHTPLLRKHRVPPTQPCGALWTARVSGSQLALHEFCLGLQGTGVPTTTFFIRAQVETSHKVSARRVMASVQLQATPSTLQKSHPQEHVVTQKNAFFQREGRVLGTTCAARWNPCRYFHNTHSHTIFLNAWVSDFFFLHHSESIFEFSFPQYSLTLEEYRPIKIFLGVQIAFFKVFPYFILFQLIKTTYEIYEWHKSSASKSKANSHQWVTLLQRAEMTEPLVWTKGSCT